MDLGLWPEAVPFDPDDDTGSRELDSYLTGMEFPPAALVVAGCGTRASEWAPRAAIGLARALVAGGAEVLLADLEFEDPSLHGLLSESVIEGLSDVILFGSSLERVTVLPAGQGFEFVATGGHAPDPVALMGDTGWSRILGELAARRTLFLGYAHFDAAGLDTLIERIPDVIILASPGEMSRTAALLPDGIRIAATIRPAHDVAAEPVGAADPTEAPDAAAEVGPDEEVAATQDTAAPREPDAVEPPADSLEVEAPGTGAPARVPDEGTERIRLPKDEARDALIADLRARQRAAMARAAASPPEATDAASSALEDTSVDADSGEPGLELRRDISTHTRTTPHSRRGRIIAAAAVIVAALATIGYLVFGRGGGAGNAPTLPATRAAPQASPEPAGEPVEWSVAVEAQEGLAAALRSAGVLETRDSSIAFFVSPAVVAGALWYRVLAGPLADSMAAVTAMDRLVDMGLKRASGVWDVRHTPLTYLLGRFRLRTDAVERMHELNDDGVPAYIVEVPYTRGDPWYHVYGGAYRDRPEAERMGQILRDAGLPDSLVVRVGRAAS